MINSLQNRTGIILAAGIGSRLDRSDTVPFLKPLASIQGKSLLIRNMENHEKAGCHQVVVVLGWESDTIKKRVEKDYIGPLEVHFVYNRRHDLQNGISVLAARPYVVGDFVLTMADHLFDDKIMYFIAGHYPPTGGATLCVDYKIETTFDMEDATKVLEVSGRIKTIGKTISPFNCIDTGAFVGTSGLFDAINEVYARKGDASLSEGVQILADAGRMTVLNIEDAFWQDIDTPDMLHHAKMLIKKKHNNS